MWSEGPPPHPFPQGFHYLRMSLHVRVLTTKRTHVPTGVLVRCHWPQCCMSNKPRRPDMRKMFTKCEDEREGSGVWVAQLLHPPDPLYLPSPGTGLPRRWPKRQTQSHTIDPNPQRGQN